MAKVFILGAMVASTVVSGLMVNNMVKESIVMLTVIVEQVFGMRVKEQCGLTMNESLFFTLLHKIIPEYLT